MLQRLVVRPRAPFGRGPGDDLVRVLDVAGFAGAGWGGVARRRPPAVAVVHHLVDARRAEALARIAEFPGAALCADAGVGHFQVHRLVLLVYVAGEEHERHPITRRQRALDPVARWRGVFVELVQRRPVGAVPERPGRFAAGERLPGGVREPEPQAALERGLEVAHPLELAPALGGAPPGVEAAAATGLRDVLPGERAAADRLMHALDLGEVQRPARIADEDRARHLQRRGRLPAAGRNGARPRRDDLPAREQPLHARVILVLLEGLEGLQARILVVEADDVTDVHAVLVEVIQEAAGVGVRVGRPAQRMLDAPRAYAPGGQLPQLLVPQSEGLRAVPAAEVGLRDQLPGERAAGAFREHREGGVDLHGGGEVRAGLAVAVQPHVADANALDGSALVEHGLRGGETREHLDAGGFGLGGEPRRELPERDDVVAVV